MITSFPFLSQVNSVNFTILLKFASEKLESIGNRKIDNSLLFAIPVILCSLIVLIYFIFFWEKNGKFPNLARSGAFEIFRVTIFFFVGVWPFWWPNLRAENKKANSARKPDMGVNRGEKGKKMCYVSQPPSDPPDTWGATWVRKFHRSKKKRRFRPLLVPMSTLFITCFLGLLSGRDMYLGARAPAVPSALRVP